MNGSRHDPSDNTPHIVYLTRSIQFPVSYELAVHLHLDTMLPTHFYTPTQLSGMIRCSILIWPALGLPLIFCISHCFSQAMTSFPPTCTYGVDCITYISSDILGLLHCVECTFPFEHNNIEFN